MPSNDSRERDEDFCPVPEPSSEELEWKEFIPDSEPQYARLGDALDELKESIETVYREGLMTPELRADLIKLGQAAIKRLESQEW